MTASSPVDLSGGPAPTGGSSSHGPTKDPRASFGPRTLTEPELVAWGERIGATVRTPVFIALRGQLGAGKSVLARAIARGAGVRGPMPSPTFNLVFHYTGTHGRTVAHLDLYRLTDPDEVWELGWREFPDHDQIVLVEWPERAEQLLPELRWDIMLSVPDPAAPLREVRGQPLGDVPIIPPP